MNLLFFIIGILFTSNFHYHKPTITCDYPVLFFEQDSIPPKGVIKVKELTIPNKKKKEKKKKETNKEEKSIRKNQSEKIADVTKTKAYIAKQKNKEREATKKKEVVTDKKKENKNSEGLTLEEELRILAKANDINTKNKIHPNNQDKCKFAFDVIDEFTGTQKKGLYARDFFSYTPDEYRKFIKEGDFIRCEGFLSQSTGGLLALNINLYVASKEAKYKFGGIKANSTMVLRSMNGKSFILMTYQGAEAKIVDNMTIYQCSFAINKTDLKALQTTEVDAVKISFQKGFQNYDVFYLDFLIDQFPCFD